MRKRLICFDEGYLQVPESALESFAPWRLKGKGVFETMRSYRGRIFLFDQHFQRLAKGLRHFEIPFVSLHKCGHIRKEIEEVLRRNHLKNARVRLTVWRDYKGIHYSILVFPLEVLTERQYQKGYRACFVRSPIRFNTPAYKSIDYKLFLNFYHKAIRKGYEEAILLNRDDQVVEGTRTNLFYIKGKVLYTPSLQLGCLCGITRQTTIELARHMGFRVKQIAFRSDDLLGADEAFLTNSVLEIMPLTYLGKITVATGLAGPVTGQLLERYRSHAVPS